VLLEHAHAAGVPPLGPLRVARIHRRHGSREICIYKFSSKIQKRNA
jgi:hypothetical protein